MFKSTYVPGCCIGEYAGGSGCVGWTSKPWDSSGGCCCHPIALYAFGSGCEIMG